MRLLTMRIVALLTCLALIGASCTSSPPEEAREQESSRASVPARCPTLGRPTKHGEITFVVGRKLLALAPWTGRIRCIARMREGQNLAWGGEADRVMATTSRGAMVLTGADRSFLVPDDTMPVFEGLSRPTGTSVIAISGDGSRLFKLPIDGGPAEDISFLKDHDEAVYHPAGTHIAVVGTDKSGFHAMWLVNNLGKDPQLIADDHSAERLYSLAFSHDGNTLFFAADHGNHQDLHALALHPGEEGLDTRLETIYSGKDPVGPVVVSEFSSTPLVAFQVGACDTKLESFVYDGDEPVRITEGESEPVGWLPDGRLVLLEHKEPCDDAPGKLALYGDGRVVKLAPELDVGDAAVRAALPPPPKPPEERLPPAVTA